MDSYAPLRHVTERHISDRGACGKPCAAPIMPHMNAPQSIRVLGLDVDGVLTDGGLYYDDSGRGLRRFNVLDGFAMRWFQKLGGKLFIISGKDSPAVAARAAELQVDHVIQGSRDKLCDLLALLPALGAELPEIAFLGDDLPDLPLMLRCGYPMAVADAEPAITRAARYVTRRAGGHGAVRDCIEHLLSADGRWAEVERHYREQAQR